MKTHFAWKNQSFVFRLSPKLSPHAVPATKSDAPTPPNTAPDTKNEPHVTYETSSARRGASGITLQHHQILRLLPLEYRLLNLYCQ